MVIFAFVISCILSEYKFIDMKLSWYFHVTPVVLLPVIYGIGLLYISKWVSTGKLSILLETIGQASMEIMYLQMIVIRYCEIGFQGTGLALMELLGSVLVGVCMHQIVGYIKKKTPFGQRGNQ